MKNYALERALRKMYGNGIIEALEQADHKDLDRMRYVIKCETCKPEKVFYETTLRGARILFRNVKSFPPIPFHFYIEAARHFMDNGFFHSIRAFVVLGLDSTVVKDFSSEWKSQFAHQKLMVETANKKKGENVSFEEAMKRELDFLEKRSDEAYGKPEKPQKSK